MANKAPDRAVKLRWLGTHSLIGVPARDLTAEEADKHAAVIAAAEKAHGFALYEPVASPQPAPKAEQAGKKE
jgi:hypothetical protein